MMKGWASGDGGDLRLRTHALMREHPELSGHAFIKNSDAHSLGCIPDPRGFIETDGESAAEIIKTLYNLSR
jgi:hypothetical protein